jgi:hypothetical protein
MKELEFRSPKFLTLGMKINLSKRLRLKVRVIIEWEGNIKNIKRWK